MAGRFDEHQQDGMNLANATAVFAGGPGSGCHGPTCGRPHGLTDMLKHTAEHMPAFANWAALYRNGHAGVVEPFNAEEKKHLKGVVSGMACKRGYCYMNAQKIAAYNNDKALKYMEGLVTVHDVPIEHSWLEYKGKVFDPTLLTLDGKRKDKAEAGEYFGVEVPKHLIFKNWSSTQLYAPVTHNPKFRDEVFKK